MSEATEAARQHFTPNYRQPDLVMVRGEGVWVFDEQGRRYLDAIAGIAVSALGHCDKGLQQAVHDQVDRLWHMSNLFYTRPSMDLAALLTRHTFAQRVFFCNSGAEANEALMKAARRAQHDLGTGRFEIIAAERSFHGRTFATVTATGQPKYHVGFEPMLPGIDHVPYGDLDAMRDRLTHQTAAILVEPIQGEGGVITPPDGYLKGLRELADQSGAFLLFDEVQTGVGRTGTLLAAEFEGVVPDGCSLAKGLGGGLPIGAFLAGPALADCLVPGTHASTFGGNPVCARAAIEVIERLVRDGLLEQIRSTSAYLESKLSDLIEAHPVAAGLRGRGFLRGLELTSADPELPARARAHGLLIGMVDANQVVRIAPPLTITEVEIDDLCDRLRLSLEA